MANLADKYSLFIVECVALIFLLNLVEKVNEIIFYNLLTWEESCKVKDVDASRLR